MKPEREIYQALEERYSITPQESVFIDDLEVNVEAARNYGYSGIIFKSRDPAEEELKKLNLIK